ncbi:unnamed protein product [Clonostachys rosea f. rosea IK726]|uniref:Uncharacterized protein n=1 Tax=Clonostachys rosea f. rosea IK726 TaxID=1349383 RepID=A0ACA9T5W2_BIOOC|nr:unnamed protein product [Clonostachys rosea f. rosea IK726]
MSDKPKEMNLSRFIYNLLLCSVYNRFIASLRDPEAKVMEDKTRAGKRPVLEQARYALLRWVYNT